MNNKTPPNKSNQDLIRYAGLGTQILAALGLAVFAGLKGDKWLHTSPLLICLLPLLILSVIFYKLMKETTPKVRKVTKDSFGDSPGEPSTKPPEDEK